MNKKYKLSDFYVGELYIPNYLHNLCNEDIIKEYCNLIRNGAIENNVYNNVYLKTKNNYHSVFTIFIKTDNKILCVQNGKIYYDSTLSFYKNLKPFSDFILPNDQKKLTDLSIKKSLNLFDKLFKKKTQPSFSKDKTIYNLNDFYVGTLNLHIIHKSNKNKQYLNNLEKKVLFNKTCYFGGYGTEHNDYEFFKCLFIKEQEGVLNLNNNHHYQNGTLSYNEYDRSAFNGSYYDWMDNLTNYLNNKEISEYQKLTLRDAYKLYEKYVLSNKDNKIKKLINKLK